MKRNNGKKDNFPSGKKGYELWKKGEGLTKEADLPGLEFLSNEQLFFVGFARSFCSSTKKEAQELALKIDSHSPNRARINLAVSNSPQFSKAFKCNFEKETCSLW